MKPFFTVRVVLLVLSLLIQSSNAWASSLELNQDNLKAVVKTSPSAPEMPKNLPDGDASGRRLSFELGQTYSTLNDETLKNIPLSPCVAQKHNHYLNVVLTPWSLEADKGKVLITPYIGSGLGLIYKDGHISFRDIARNDNTTINGMLGFDIATSGPLTFSMRYQKFWSRLPGDREADFVNVKANYNF